MSASADPARGAEYKTFQATLMRLSIHAADGAFRGKPVSGKPPACLKKAWL